MSIVQSLRQWLFRFGRDEQLPIVLTQRRIFIVPTRVGLLFVVVLIVMLLGAINYDLSLGHALLLAAGMYAAGLPAQLWGWSAGSAFISARVTGRTSLCTGCTDTATHWPLSSVGSG